MDTKPNILALVAQTNEIVKAHRTQTAPLRSPEMTYHEVCAVESHTVVSQKALALYGLICNLLSRKIINNPDQLQ